MISQKKIFIESEQNTIEQLKGRLREILNQITKDNGIAVNAHRPPTIYPNLWVFDNNALKRITKYMSGDHSQQANIDTKPKYNYILSLLNYVYGMIVIKNFAELNMFIPTEMLNKNFQMSSIFEKLTYVFRERNYGRVRIFFENSIGIDEGGLYRSFFDGLNKEILEATIYGKPVFFNNTKNVNDTLNTLTFDFNTCQFFCDQLNNDLYDRYVGVSDLISKLLNQNMINIGPNLNINLLNTIKLHKNEKLIDPYDCYFLIGYMIGLNMILKDDKTLYFNLSPATIYTLLTKDLQSLLSNAVIIKHLIDDMNKNTSSQYQHKSKCNDNDVICKKCETICQICDLNNHNMNKELCERLKNTIRTNILGLDGVGFDDKSLIQMINTHAKLMLSDLNDTYNASMSITFNLDSYPIYLPMFMYKNDEQYLFDIAKVKNVLASYGLSSLKLLDESHLKNADKQILDGILLRKDLLSINGFKEINIPNVIYVNNNTVYDIPGTVVTDSNGAELKLIDTKLHLKTFKYHEFIDESNIEFTSCNPASLLQYIELAFMFKFGFMLSVSATTNMDWIMGTSKLEDGITIGYNTLLPTKVSMTNFKKCIRYYALTELLKIVPDYDINTHIDKDYYKNYDKEQFDINKTIEIMRSIMQLSKNDVIVFETKKDNNVGVPTISYYPVDKITLHALNNKISIVEDSLSSANYYIQSKVVGSESMYGVYDEITFFSDHLPKPLPFIRLNSDNNAELIEYCKNMNVTLNYTFPVSIDENKIVLNEIAVQSRQQYEPYAKMYHAHIKKICEPNKTYNVYSILDNNDQVFIKDPCTLIKFINYSNIIDIMIHYKNYNYITLNEYDDLIKKIREISKKPINKNEKNTIFNDGKFMSLLFRFGTKLVDINHKMFDQLINIVAIFSDENMIKRDILISYLLHCVNIKLSSHFIKPVDNLLDKIFKIAFEPIKYDVNNRIMLNFDEIEKLFGLNININEIRNFSCNFEEINAGNICRYVQITDLKLDNQVTHQWASEFHETMTTYQNQLINFVLDEQYMDEKYDQVYVDIYNAVGSSITMFIDSIDNEKIKKHLFVIITGLPFDTEIFCSISLKELPSLKYKINLDHKLGSPNHFVTSKDRYMLIDNLKRQNGLVDLGVYERDNKTKLYELNVNNFNKLINAIYNDTQPFSKNENQEEFKNENQEEFKYYNYKGSLIPVVHTCTKTIDLDLYIAELVLLYGSSENSKLIANLIRIHVFESLLSLIKHTNVSMYTLC